ncbi:NAD(P)-dependent alcohol dehydrogenase [Lysobacter claricitrinus]|uniref:NAD(P)-dependent alcohol dehydrogenase n=1 Tax=Lysobacter claricitrinus TaxID=3367728 RepID=UPI0037DA98A3
MKTLRQLAYGGVETLQWVERPLPAPAADELRVRVHAVSINAMDWRFMAGGALSRLMTGVRRPRLGPGVDLAGVVDAVGESAGGWQEGDAVFGSARGALSEFVCAKAMRLALKPGALSFVDAAALPVAGQTALQALRDIAGVQAGQRVLVNGASGGVGAFTVQIATLLGATVTGVCGPKNVGFVRALGAATVVDYSTTDFTSTVERYDAIVDLIGNHPLREMRRLLLPGGVHIAAGFHAPGMQPLVQVVKVVAANAVHGERQTTFIAQQNVDDLAWLADRVSAGELSAPVGHVYPRDAAVDAMAAMATGHARGKLVVTMRDE